MKTDEARTTVGTFSGGGIKANLTAILKNKNMLEIGSYLVIPTDDRLFYTLVVDLNYQPSDPRYASQPLENWLPKWLAKRVNLRAIKRMAELMPSMTINRLGADAGKVSPFVSLPPLHAPVCLPTDTDIADLFGDQNKAGFFVIGYTREQHYPITLDLRLLCRRSVGVSGATGTGKSQLIRVLLAGIMEQRLASALVFDPHNDYGYDDVSSDTGKQLVGLKNLFPSQVVTIGLGKTATVRGNKPDYNLEISLQDIDPEDILLLDELNLTPATSTITSALVQNFGRQWLAEFLKLRRVNTEPANKKTSSEEKTPEGSVAFWANKVGVSRQSADALWSKLSRIARLGYVSAQPDAARSIGVILNALLQGKTVILSFDDHKNDLDYLLVSNLLARHISNLYQKNADSYRSKNAQDHRPLIIVVDEAHRFLNQTHASQTVFGGLARELRKSAVVLWCCTQRMSEIDDKISSQIGTRFSGWLGDEDDIKAVVSGLPGKDMLRRMIANLRPSGQCVVLGYGTPSPISIDVKRVDDQFVKEMSQQKNK